MPYRQQHKTVNFGFKLFNGTPKFPYKFKEIISNNNDKVYRKNFQNGLQVLAGISF